MMWSILITAVFILYWLHDRFSRRHLYRLAKKLPGFKPWPIIGNLPMLAGSPEDVQIFIKKLGALSLQHKGVYTLWLGPDLYSVVTDPDDIEKILTTFLKKPAVYKFAIPILGTGLTTSDLLIWKRHRKAMLPSFNQNVLNYFIETFHRKSMDLTKKLDAHVGKGLFDVSEIVSITTLDTICETAMDTHLEEVDKCSEVPLHKALTEVTKMVTHRTSRIWLWLDIMYYRTSHGKLFKMYLNSIHKLPANILLRKLEQKARTSNDGSNDHYDTAINGDSKKDLSKRALLNRMLESKTGLTDEEVFDEVTTITLAAYDTTTVTSSLVLQAIGSYPEVQNKIVEELNSIFDGSGRPISKEDLTKMTYLEYTIKETMRLYTVAPLFGRAIDRDCKLKHYTLPQGSSALICAGTVHTDEAIWGPDVMEFKPERWLPELSAKRHPCSFLPFSYGARNCIGLLYAMMSIKIFITNVLRTYTVSADIERATISFGLVARAKDGHLIQIERRLGRNIST